MDTLIIQYVIIEKMSSFCYLKSNSTVKPRLLMTLQMFGEGSSHDDLFSLHELGFSIILGDFLALTCEPSCHTIENLALV